MLALITLIADTYLLPYKGIQKLSESVVGKVRFGNVDFHKNVILKSS